MVSLGGGRRTYGLALACGTVLLATAAGAQIFSPSPQTPGTIRVQINVGGPIPLNSADDQKKQAEKARMQLYENARDECDQLSVAFQARCRLVSLNIIVNNQVVGNFQALNATGSAIYELDPEALSAPKR